jgi:hypothetical protein
MGAGAIAQKCSVNRWRQRSPELSHSASARSGRCRRAAAPRRRSSRR